MAPSSGARRDRARRRNMGREQSAGTAQSVTARSVSSSLLARVRRPRWARTRTVPGRLPMMPATWATSSPAMVRRSTASRSTGRELGDQRQRGLGLDRAHGALAGVLALGHDRRGTERDRVDGDRRPSGLATEVVDGAPARHGEQPRPERGVVAVEADDRRGHGGPGLRRDVVRGIAAGDPEVAQQRRLVLAPDGGERSRIAVAASVPTPPGRTFPSSSPRSSSAMFDSAGDVERFVRSAPPSGAG